MIIVIAAITGGYFLYTRHQYVLFGLLIFLLLVERGSHTMMRRSYRRALSLGATQEVAINNIPNWLSQANMVCYIAIVALFIYGVAGIWFH